VFALIARLFDLEWLPAIVVGGALSMSSTTIILHQLTESCAIIAVELPPVDDVRRHLDVEG